MDGPPFTSAVTQTAMKAPDVPMKSTCPAPIRPTRTAWRIVVKPLIRSAANTAHDRKPADCPAIWTTMTTVRMTGASMIMAA